MKTVDFEKHKFDTRWKFATFVLIMFFAGYLQLIHAPMANEFISLVIGLIGGSIAPKVIDG